MQQLIDYIVGGLLAIDATLIILFMVIDFISKDTVVRDNIKKSFSVLVVITIILIYLGVSAWL